jgi:hypothetical protein
VSSTTDFSTLGRLGTSDARRSGPRRRRGQRSTRPVIRRAGRDGAAAAIGRMTVPRLAGIALAGVVLLLWMLGALVGSQVQVLPAVTMASPSVDPLLEADLLAGATQTVATGAVRLMPGGGSAASAVTAPQAFAAVDDVALHLPFAAGQAVVFTEADLAAALPLAPVGTMTDNANPEGYRQTRTTVGPDYAVAPPTTGVRPATGMAVLLAAAGTPVLAPVQGVVDEVAPATQGAGWVIRITPQGRPDLHVVLRGVDAPTVVAGDAVTVGHTPLGAVGPGAVLDAAQNPLALPGTFLHVQPAVAGGPSGSGTPVAPAGR